MGFLFSLFPFSFSTTSFSKISCLMKLNNVVFNVQNILNTVYINFIILAVQSLRLGGTVLLQLIPISFPVSGETLFSLLRYQLIRFFLYMYERKIDVFPVWKLRMGREIPWEGALLKRLYSVCLSSDCVL